MQLDPGGAMNQTVEDGIGEGWVVELAVPIGHRQLTGDDHRAPAEAVIEDLEEVACARGVDRRQTTVVGTKPCFFNSPRTMRLSHCNCLEKPLTIYRDFGVNLVNLTKPTG